MAKLTLAILDYAQSAPRSLPTKEVVAYLTADGRPTNKASANVVIRTEIAAGDVSASVLGPDIDARRKLEKCRGTDMSAKISDMQTEALEAPVEDRPILEAEIRAMQERQSLDFIEALPSPLYVPLQQAPQQLQFQVGPELLQLQQQLDLLR